ncbi:50S ribosomal protein L4 [Kallotenue papyrolyticum]|uniref:50S ribosomal protein L4 n=1 Tax=Kallotenue papyrolyticum TaxID=1325125 RepID=UPI0004785DAE|nr:50S ribosomal protein L4 [Kallotenue papyrolyticum]
MQATLYNQSGAQIGTIELDDYIFGIEPNVPVMHQMLVLQNANARQGTHSTRTRGEVSGSTRKLYRQKGTGRARQGAIRAPHHSGGGVVFGPKPRKYTQRMPRKMRRLAVRSALSAKQRDGAIRFVDRLQLETIRTKAMLEVLRAFELERQKTLIVLPEKDETLIRSANNLPNVKTLLAMYLNVRDLLKYDVVIMPQAALEQVNAWLGRADAAQPQEAA